LEFKQADIICIFSATALLSLASGGHHWSLLVWN